MAVIKSQIYAAMQQDFGTAVLMAHDETELAKQSDDFKEGVAHFVERRSAAFPPFVNSHM